MRKSDFTYLFFRETLNKAFPARKSRPLAAFLCDFLRIPPEASKEKLI